MSTPNSNICIVLPGSGPAEVFTNVYPRSCREIVRDRKLLEPVSRYRLRDFDSRQWQQKKAETERQSVLASLRLESDKESLFTKLFPNP